MNEAVFDASAMLALIQGERGADRLTDEILDRSVASTVNLAEVQSKLVKASNDPDRAWEAVLSAVTAIVPYSSEQAKIAGSLVAMTQPFGLSLGDRSCLALAIELNAEVYTTEKLWKNLKIDVPIHVIR